MTNRNSEPDGALGAGIVLVGLTVVFFLLATKDMDIPQRAAIFSGYGVLIAAITAICIAISGSMRAENDSKKRAASAAIIASNNLYELHAILSVLAENKTLVMANKVGYSSWLSTVSGKIGMLPRVIEDKYLPIVAELSGVDLKLLCLADSWLEKFKRKHLFGPAVTTAYVVEHFDSFYEEVLAGQKHITIAADRIWDASGLRGTKPWSGQAPSWANPN